MGKSEKTTLKIPWGLGMNIELEHLSLGPIVDKGYVY
jgi:hypothetical protein